MGYVARSALAAAVSQAGGLGVIAAANLTPRELREEIRKVREHTDRPFGVDILFASVKVSGSEADQFTDTVRAWADVTLELQVPVLVAGLGNPGPVTAAAHRQGMKVMALCGNVKQALDHAANGVDVVIAQGHEAGGHTGHIAGMVLIPAVVDAVAPRLVMAAGGMADGRGIVAALALGAQGVLDGHALHRHAGGVLSRQLQAARGRAGGRRHRGDARGQRQAVPPDPQRVHARVGEARGGDPALPPIQGVRVGREAGIRAREQGDVENGNAPCGQSAALIRGIIPAGEVVRRLVAEAEEVLARLAR